jgi:16S rRNA (cytidine1402-2'-O)-methyltransferase
MAGAVRSGCLYLVGTPIGNLEDITFRAVRILSEVDLVAAEDTRSARKLLTHHGVPAGRRIRSYFKDNEARRGAELVARLEAGASVAVISESGMPGISDPGARLVTRCIEAGIAVDVIPGPNAALSALVLSGLDTDRFSFLGFLPRKGRRQRAVLEQLPFEPGTLVLHEAPGRVGATLSTLAEVLGERRGAVVREITKLHQEVARGALGELARRYAAARPRGEVTLVIAGSDAARQTIPQADLMIEIQARLERGESPRAIADALAAHGRRTVYQAALKLRGAASS